MNKKKCSCGAEIPNMGPFKMAMCLDCAYVIFREMGLHLSPDGEEEIQDWLEHHRAPEERE